MNVSIIYGACKRYDAISEAVRGTIHAISDKLGWSCRLFAYVCDFPELDYNIVGGVSEILLNDYFISSDVIIYHFGIYYDLFNISLIGNGHATQIVRYHNVTPKAFMPRDMHSLLDKSERQIANLLKVDEIWADSRFNKDDLVRYGIPEGIVKVLPLYVKENHTNFIRADKPHDIVRVLYIGRFVASKGVTDLLRAIAIARETANTPFLVDLVGNVEFSDQSYIAEINNLIESLNIGDVVIFSGEVSDGELLSRLRRSHIFVIASYHEGFCVPLIEAMQAKCLPIAYAAGNIPDLVGSLGVLINPGDWKGFGQELGRFVRFFGQNNQGKGNSSLPLKAGPIRLDAYDKQLENHLALYRYEVFRDRIVAALRATLSGD